MNIFRQKKKLIIFGLEDFADIAYEYFTYDSEYEVVAFTAHEKFVLESSKMGKPVIKFEEIQKYFNPKKFSIFVAITYHDMNKLRENILNECRALGFKPASYVSTKSFVWKNVKLGEHVFVFENNTIQPFVEIGDNVVLWSGNHIGHHTRIASHNFISSQVVVAGWVSILDHTFVGVNSTITNGVSIGSYNWINAGSRVSKNSKSYTYFSEAQTKDAELNLVSLNQSLSKKSNLRNQ
jgi:sugar O-acyltransferase (sialic acid O-acetyltransferase NeuD family)